jgi:hypothetical protein
MAIYSEKAAQRGFLIGAAATKGADQSWREIQAGGMLRRSYRRIPLCALALVPGI